jgi:DNA-directed RNA polymerase subunit E"
MAATQKVCKKCKIFVSGSKCPKCGGTEFSDSHKGKVVILNPEESEVAKELGIKEKGTYAIKV